MISALYADSFFSSVQESIIESLDSLQQQLQLINSPRIDLIRDLTAQIKGLPLGTLEKADLEKTEKMISQFQAAKEKLQQEKLILDSLRFETMHDRYHTITQAHGTTFQWIFQPESFPLSDPRSAIGFRDWLLSGNGTFWVSGKPGSGKSTLMRYLSDCTDTQEYLKSWAGSTKLITASFYFWIAGTGLQRSQRGLLRQLLFQILHAHPELIPDICPEFWAVREHLHFPEWKLDHLTRALDRLKDISNSTKICFFIDGLDEYDGYDFELIKIIKALAQVPNIKLCISSRPWPSFSDAFGTHNQRKLCLEDLTQNDIRMFTEDELNEYHQFDELRLNKDMYVNIVEEITRKAQGVFLWVFLVVRSLRNGISNGDSASLLRQRLAEIPSNLEIFFEKIISSVEPIYREQMALVFQIALLSPEPINLAVLWFLDEPSEYELGTSRVSLNEGDIARVEALMSRRLNGRYKGLLEATGQGDHLTANFLHRTIRDYLQTKKGFSLITLPGLNPFSKFCRALLAYTATYGPGGIQGYTVIVLFIVFARWAEQQSEPLDYELINEMIRLTSGGPYPRFSRGVLREMVRYGFLSGLRYFLLQCPEVYQQEERWIIALAMKQPSKRAKDIFGCQSATNTLNWMMRNVAQPRTRTNDRILLLESLMSEQSDNRFQQGSASNQAFLDLRHITDFPWFGWNGSKPSEFYGGATISIRLKNLVNIYSNLLDNGFDSNLRVGNTTIWQSWLWYICDFQLSHGLYSHICVRVIRLFLEHGANPFETVDYDDPHSRLRFALNPDRREKDGLISVSFIVNNLFEENQRRALEKILERAKEQWQNRQSSRKTDDRSRLKRGFDSQANISQTQIQSISKKRRT